MNSEVIKEFLIAINYKTDASSEKKFTDGLKSATINAGKVAASVEAAAAAVYTAVGLMAANFEKLYYSSQRIGASAENIKAFTFAAGQLGSTADSAQNSLESFAQKMRATGNGYNSLFRQFGIETKGMDNLEKLSALFQNKGFQGQSYAVQMRYAEVLGISENDFRAIRTGEFGKQADLARAKMHKIGLDSNQAAADSVKFMNGWRELQLTIGTILGAAESKFLQDGSGGFKGLTDYLDQHGKQIADTLAWIGKIIVDVAKDIAEFLVWLNKWIPATDDANDKTDMWRKGLEALAVLLVLRLIPGLSSVLRLLGSLSVLRLAPWLLSALGIGGAAALAVGGAAAYGASLEEGSIDPLTGTKVVSFKNSQLGKWWSKTMPSWAGGGGGGRAPGEAGPPTSAEKKANEAESYNYWRSQGASHTLASMLGGGEAREGGFKTHVSGDSGLAGGAMQWHAARKNEILAKTGFDVWGGSHLDQLKGARWEMEHGSAGGKVWNKLMNAKTREEMARILVEQYERPRNQVQGVIDNLRFGAGIERRYAGIDGARQPGANLMPAPSFDPNRTFRMPALGTTPGGSNTNSTTNNSPVLNSNVNVNVTGGADPEHIGLTIKKTMRGENAQAVRDLAGSTQ